MKYYKPIVYSYFESTKNLLKKLHRMTSNLDRGEMPQCKYINFSCKDLQFDNFNYVLEVEKKCSNVCQSYCAHRNIFTLAEPKINRC